MFIESTNDKSFRISMWVFQVNQVVARCGLQTFVVCVGRPDKTIRSSSVNRGWYGGMVVRHKK